MYIYTRTHTCIHSYTRINELQTRIPAERTKEAEIAGFDPALLAQFRREFGAKDNTSFGEFKKCLSLYVEVRMRTYGYIHTHTHIHSCRCC